ncbi:EAL domain-containing protein [Paenibacillus chartarius]|uniref:EAL domain-containing protein n=1 Tax=Paenibacillus chartarius TaxID=747481 RepID=A0ABV6DSC8_9BACL
MMALQNIKLPALSEVVPYYQPIVSLQTLRVYGYEALGRWLADGERVQSLGPFFANPHVRDNEHIQIDRHLRQLAMSHLVAAGGEERLFLNLKPSWIYRTFRERGRLETLDIIDRAGIDPQRIVIEITEEEFTSPLQELTEIVELYRERGCAIAIDDIGSGSSNFDRIALLRPQIMKVDLTIMKKSGTHAGYRSLLQSFSILAERVGASLLIEGIETQDDLRGALQAGARYLQGYLFARAEPELQPAGAYAGLLREEIKRFANRAIRQQERLQALQEQLHAALHQAGADGGDAPERGFDAADEALAELLAELPPITQRVYLCREDGYQVSSNFSRRNGGWVREERYRGSNWSWRPYFISNIVMLKRQRQGTLSQVYTDLDTSLPIQTFSCPYGDKFYLFVDVGLEAEG